MRIILWSLVVASFPAWAGPNGHISCEDHETGTTLSVFDISLKNGAAILRLEGDFLVGETRYKFLGPQQPLLSKLVAYSDQQVTISYSNGTTELPLLSLHDQAKPLGKLKSLTYVNNNPVAFAQTRRGSAILEIEGSAVKTIQFPRCHYIGGQVGNWKSLFSQD